MKALVHTAPLKFEYRDVSEPEFGDDDVPVRVKAVAICGSDVHGYTGTTGRRIPPIIMGHEAGGIVEAIGRNVQNVAVRDRITGRIQAKSLISRIMPLADGQQAFDALHRGEDL